MGNTIGIECSFNYIRLTSIVVKREMKSCSDAIFNDRIGTDRGDHNNYTYNSETQEEKANCFRFNKSIGNLNVNESVKCKSAPMQPHENYVQMQKDMFQYILNIEHLISGSVHVVILHKNVEKNEHLEFSPTEHIKHMKKEQLVEEPFFLYNHLVNQRSGIRKSSKQSDPLLDDEIAQIYFLTIKLASLEEAIEKCKKEIIMYTVINITGRKSNYLKKKIYDFKKVNNIHSQKEIKCITNALLFLAKHYPSSLHKYVKEQNKCEKEDYHNDVNKNRNALSHHFLNIMETTNIYPYLIVNVKRDVSYYLVNEENVVKRVGSCFISYKSVQGLFFLITGKLYSMEKICHLAKNGKNQTFDMTVGDIYGTSYGNAGLSSDLTASFFGKAQIIENVKGFFDSLFQDVHVIANSNYKNSYWEESFTGSESGSDSDEHGIQNSQHSFYSQSEEEYPQDVVQSNCILCHGSGTSNICICSTSFPHFEFQSYSDSSIMSGMQNNRTRKFKGKQHSYIVKEECESAPECDLNICEKVNFCRRRKKSAHFLQLANSYKKSFERKKKSPKNYEQVRQNFLNFNKKCVKEKGTNRIAIDELPVNMGETSIIGKCTKDNNGQVNHLNHAKNNGNYYQDDNANDSQKENLNSYECDLSKSLLSMAIFNMAQQSYIHSQLHNVKNVFFSGYLLDNSTCLELMKILINFMYHNEQQLHFCKFSSYMSSFGSAIQSLPWDR
ncbi:hypothetical protein, conserved [Plasmodium gonderi]|uniref:Pantothenate kinase n=1 Tax=Plasmodium gonderi TaxID=77519 RepID=A0A1Y1JPU5_PLAGO|nr:hypothetical protein, conserved [Plasmodium gonderi]GAW82862.1 hypothetical protein, conserved [Plasmodium gonderi]